MKGILWVIVCVGLALLGCSGPTATSKEVPTATLEPVPAGYYRIVSIVKHPGLIKCEGESESLMTIFSHAGGLNNSDYDRKLTISLVYAGKTRIFKIEKILTLESDDPLVPCGATIRVTRRLGIE
jgi:hypothetical protein